MRPCRATKLLGCAIAVSPSAAFTGGLTLSTASSRQGLGRRRATTMMVVDPTTVHYVGDCMSAVGNTGLDQVWLSHVLHGEFHPQQTLPTVNLKDDSIFPSVGTCSIRRERDAGR